MRPERRAWLRLLAIQAGWNYEFMSGIGIGHATEPLLEDLTESDPSRHADALRRAGGFFNSHPYLAGVAVGAEARAEYDGIAPAQVARLRAALCSPLGALGDQLFWAGLWPAVLGAAVIAGAVGAGWWVPAGAVALMLAVRGATTRWALRTGLRSGFQVGAALQQTRLRSLVTPLGVAAALVVGAAVPLMLRAGLRGSGSGAWALALVVAAAGIASGQRFGTRVTGVRLGLAAVVLTFFAGMILR
ncbi:MAG TPA: PTS system mannose/fructose/sorbose family transporter subunit IID [Gemmatimonadales bacterium]|jgi:PTS system mannose-specific IID component|nr:PTS system mannose/fructose/sorbose family transporter subunit IID [Gemmatimonadales bacterium]